MSTCLLVGTTCIRWCGVYLVAGCGAGEVSKPAFQGSSSSIRLAELDVGDWEQIDKSKKKTLTPSSTEFFTLSSLPRLIVKSRTSSQG